MCQIIISFGCIKALLQAMSSLQAQDCSLSLEQCPALSSYNSWDWVRWQWTEKLKQYI